MGAKISYLCFNEVALGEGNSGCAASAPKFVPVATGRVFGRLKRGCRAVEGLFRLGEITGFGQQDGQKQLIADQVPFPFVRHRDIGLLQTYRVRDLSELPFFRRERAHTKLTMIGWIFAGDGPDHVLRQFLARFNALFAGAFHFI